MPAIGWLSARPDPEPKNGTPKLNTPPSRATSQYPGGEALGTDTCSSAPPDCELGWSTSNAHCPVANPPTTFADPAESPYWTAGELSEHRRLPPI